MTKQEIKFDFEALPVQEVVYLLRRVGLRLLEELLGDPRAPGRVLAPGPQLLLRDLFSDKEIRFLSRSRVWNVRRCRKTGRIPFNLREDLPRSLKKLLIKSLKGKLSFPRWQVGAYNRMALALGGTAGDILPDDLWTVIGNAAWLEPDFRMTVSLKICDWLRGRQLLVPYETPTALLSPGTFWLLIALTRVKPRKRRHWFSRLERAAARNGMRLRQEAQLQMMNNHWAGFWDQWIMKLAGQRWGPCFKQLETRLCQALAALPLMGSGAGSTLCGKKRRPGRPGAPAPVKLIHRISDRLDHIKRHPRPEMDFRRIALLNLSNPDWQKDIPAFFAEDRGGA